MIDFQQHHVCFVTMFSFFLFSFSFFYFAALQGLLINFLLKLKNKGLKRPLYSLPFLPLEDNGIEGENPSEARTIKIALWKGFTGSV